MTKTAFFSIAYYLSTDSGHFLHYHKAVERAVRPFVDRFGVYISRNNALKALPKEWHAWFHPFNSTRKRRKFFKDCIRLFRLPSEKKCIFFIEFFSHKDFVRFALAALFFSKKKDMLWVLYRDDATLWKKGHRATLYFLSKALSIRFGKRFCALTDSELLGQYYEKWFKKPLTVLPIPHTCHSPPFLIKEKDKLIFSWLGGPALAKGLEIISRLLTIDDPAGEKVQLSISEATPLPPITNKITLILRTSQLSEEEYYNALLRSDVILLPYTPYTYKWRTSGIFVEAVIAGKIPFVHSGTWMAKELERHNLQELVVDWDHPHFFSEALTLIENEHMRFKLQEMQHAYQEEHNPSSFSREMHLLLNLAVE